MLAAIGTTLGRALPAAGARGGPRAVTACIGLLCSLVLAGCGAAREVARSSVGGLPAGSRTRGEAAPATVMGGWGADVKTAALASYEVPGAMPRRIIYTAEVDLIVDRLSSAETVLLRLVNQYHGYVATNEVAGSPGSPRRGTWTVRVPVQRFEEFMLAVPKLGELQKVHRDSQDVGEEYADLQAQLSSKQTEEQRLLAHLRNSTAKLTDILAVEKELSRVRGEVERLQGRIRFLANRTELTTVTVTLSEVKEYLPAERTTFTAQIGRTFHDSLKTMGDAAAALLLLLVALAPWLVLAALVLVPGWVVVRRRRLRGSAS